MDSSKEPLTEINNKHSNAALCHIIRKLHYHSIWLSHCNEVRNKAITEGPSDAWSHPEKREQAHTSPASWTTHVGVLPDNNNSFLDYILYTQTCLFTTIILWQAIHNTPLITCSSTSSSQWIHTSTDRTNT